MEPLIAQTSSCRSKAIFFQPSGVVAAMPGILQTDGGSGDAA